MVNNPKVRSKIQLKHVHLELKFPNNSRDEPSWPAKKDSVKGLSWIKRQVAFLFFFKVAVPQHHPNVRHFGAFDREANLWIVNQLMAICPKVPSIFKGVKVTKI